jgi:hypothetical protein
MLGAGGTEAAVHAAGLAAGTPQDFPQRLHAVLGAPSGEIGGAVKHDLTRLGIFCLIVTDLLLQIGFPLFDELQTNFDSHNKFLLFIV